MTLTVTINCDNAAFEGGGGGEVARILLKLANRIEGSDDIPECNGMSLLDINGNKVGKVEVAD